MTTQQPGFVPRETFEVILENAVIPTFDLIVDVPEKGVFIARRKIAPYAGKWALPGLRMYKGEGIPDTLHRIARAEIGISVETEKARLVGQYVGKFTTEHNRQDLSTCYAVTAETDMVMPNEEHFTGHRFIQSTDEIPTATGAMYKYYLNEYFDQV